MLFFWRSEGQNDLHNNSRCCLRIFPVMQKQTEKIAPLGCVDFPSFWFWQLFQCWVERTIFLPRCYPFHHKLPQIESSMYYCLSNVKFPASLKVFDYTVNAQNFLAESKQKCLKISFQLPASACTAERTRSCEGKCSQFSKLEKLPAHGATLSGLPTCTNLTKRVIVLLLQLSFSRLIVLTGEWQTGKTLST